MSGPLLLKRLLRETGVSFEELGRTIGYSKAAVHRAVSLGRDLPVDLALREAALKVVVLDDRMMEWLGARGYRLTDALCLDPDPGPEADGRRVKSAAHAARIADGVRRSNEEKPVVAGRPCRVETHREAVMITMQALKYFKMFRSPFADDVSDAKDIFWSEDHYFLKEMMVDAAKHRGLVAVYGEVGSGKSVIRQAVFGQLEADGTKVLYPRIIDNHRITAASLLEAIVADISEEVPKRSLEARSRQVIRLLRNRAASGMRQVLVVEEAHQLNVPAMKALKRIWELADGFSRLVGIILIGQVELRDLLDESLHPELRELIRRMTRAEITGLGKDCGRYLEHKFSRVGKKLGDVMTEDAVVAIQDRLVDRSDRRRVSMAYPLTVNNMAAMAMNMAAMLGEEKVTAEVVAAL